MSRRSDPHPPEKGLDFHQYWVVIRKRWWLALGAVAVVAALMAANTLRKPKIYQATATLVIDPSAPCVLDPNMPEVMQLGTGNFWSNTDYYNTQYKIITSRSLSEEVVRKLNLHEDPKFVGPITPGASEEQMVTRAAMMLQGKIRVLPVRESRVVGIAVRDADPARAAELANTIASVYIDQNLALKLDTTRGAKRWVAEQLDEARRDLDRAEQALYAFRRDNNILSVSLEDRQNIIASTLTDFSSALTQAKKQRIELEARRKAVASLIAGQVDEGPAAFGEQGAALEILRKTWLEERRKLQLTEERYGPKHPELAYQKSRLDAAWSDLVKEGELVLKSMDAQIRAATETGSRYSGEVDRLTQEALDLNKKEIDYKRLTRDADNASQVYAALLKRLNESGLQEQDQANNMRLLDRAQVPRVAVEPNMRNAIVMTIALALLISLGLVFFVEFLDRSIKTQEDLEQAVGAPFLGFLPSVVEDAKTPGRELFVLRHPKSTAAECCRVVRTNILFCSPDKPLKTILVTSSNPVEGKTVSVVNLGIAMAQGGQRTLLVDTDMRRPRLHKVLGISNEHGVARLTVEEGPIEEAIKSTEVPNLFLLPCGPLPPNPAELLQTEKFLSLVKKLTERFDRVIFDSPPVLAVTDAAVLSRVVDGTVLVVRAGTTARDAVLRGSQRLKAVNAPIIGAVLNDVNLRHPHYASYYYQYQYKYHEMPGRPVTPEKG
jgi:capsular exopolysaccharide synthesis family protein